MAKNDLIISKKVNISDDELELAGSSLTRLQALPLEQKVLLALRRIEQFVEFYKGNCYISFSGGKDSTVLLHLVRSIYPDIPAVFADTGLEFPEIREFVKTIDNVIWVKPKMTFNKVLEKHGYPVISKEVSRYVADLQNPTENNERTRRIRLEGSAFKGGKSNTGKLSNKWQYLKDAPFKCSSECCNIMKKRPMAQYEKETGRKPIIGTMAYESRLRHQSYLKNGCNIFDSKKSQSRPLSVWLEKDIWDYINSRELEYSKIYDMGYDRTGCVFCMFGVQHEPRNDNRFIKLEKTHPKLHNYCINKLGLGEVLDYIDIPYQEETNDAILDNLTKPSRIK